MRTLKNKKNKRKTRKGGMFGRLFRQPQIEPQIGYYTEHHPNYSVGISSTRARNLYTGKLPNHT